jgi:hypothetical protein
MQNPVFWYIIEIFVSLGLAVVFVWQIENYGYGFLKLIDFVFHKLGRLVNPNPINPSNQTYSLGVKLATGLVVYAMCFFFIGLLNLLYPVVVLGFTACVSLGIWLGFRRWRRLNEIFVSLKTRRWEFFGFGAAFVILIPAFFRPPTLFDGVWYHLTIPKLFLQHHNIQYLGEALRYSVHPYLNFFWYLWPQSLPLPLVWQYLVINVINILIVLLSVQYAVGVFGNHLNWGKWWRAAAVSALSINALSVEYYGTSYNDILAYGLTFVAAGYLFELSLQKSINLKDFTVGVLILLSIALLKAFFLIFAGVLGLYLLYLGLTRIPGDFKPKITGLLICSGILGLVFFAPWVIRSLVATGNLLDPIGNPGLTQDLYDFAGSKNPFNHWTSLVWKRFFEQIWPLLSLRYSPLVLFGLMSICFSNLRAKIGDLWVVGILSFIVVYFISVVSELRYFLPSIGILMLLGFTLVVELFRRSPNIFRKIAVSLIIPASLLISYAQAGPDFYNKMYVFSGLVKSDYLRRQAEYNAFAYYSLKDSPLPAELQPKEKIMVFRVLHLAYIDRPILEPTVDYGLFEDISTASELKLLLQKQGIRYIMVKYWDMETACKEYLKLEDSQNCNDQANFKMVLTDPLQSVNWFRVQD